MPLSLVALMLATACAGRGGSTGSATPSPTLSTVDAGDASDVPADGVTPVTILIVVRNGKGASIAGQPITVDVTGSGNVVAPAMIVTDPRGRASIAIRSTTAEAKTIQLRAGDPSHGIAIGPAHEVRFVATEPSDMRSQVQAPDTYAAADGTMWVRLEVTVRDAHDNPVPGRRVELRGNDRGEVLIQPAHPTGLDGVAIGWVAGHREGEVRVEAAVETSSGPITPWQVAQVRFVARPQVAAVVTYADLDGDGRCGVGDTLSVPFTEDIALARPTMASELLTLAVDGDSLGEGATVVTSPAGDRLVVHLGPGARLRGRGHFAPSHRIANAASGVDLVGRSAVLKSAVTGLEGAPGAPADVFADFVHRPMLNTAPAHAVATADFDGDGLVDIACGGANGVVQLWRGRRDAGPALPVTLLQLEEPVGALAAVDLNRDGWTDLAIAGARDRFWLLRSKGNGAFTQPVELLALGGNVVAAGDFDQNGWMELVLAGADGRVWIGGEGGEPRFVPALKPGYPAHALVVGDFDLDGDVDLALDVSAQTICLFANDRAGTFTLAHTFAAVEPTALALADIDRDGDLDLLCGDSHGARLLTNQRGRGFVAGACLTDLPVQALRALDIDEDGDLDIVTGGPGGGIWRNDGGTFTLLPTQVATDGLVGLADADFDRDGDLDLLVWYRGTGPTLFSGSANAIRSPLQLQPDAPLAMEFDTTCQTLADLDRDGDLDLVIGLRGGGARALLNDGAGVLRDSGEALGGVDFTLAVAVGDLDRDGDLDVVTGNTVGGAERVHVNDGTGHFTETPQALGTGHTTALALGDVDGDGDLDLVVGNLGLGGDVNRLFLNDGRAEFRDSGQTLGSLETRAVILLDLDRDGDLDLVIADARGEIRVWRNDGRGRFTDFGQRLRQDPIGGVAAGDLDGDGDLDLFVASGNATGDRVWWNLGDGALVDSGQRLGNHIATGVCLFDFDGDGSLDALATTTIGGTSTLWRNDGRGAFTAADVSIPAARTASGGDTDHDGGIDVLVIGRDHRMHLLRSR